MIVKNMRIRKIFATNSKPTIEIELKTNKGTAISQVPIGTSTGRHEAIALPVEDAVRKFAMVSRYFRTNEFYNIEDVDITLHSMDKSDNFKEIGGNVALGISSAFLKAFAMEKRLEVFEYVYGIVSQQRKRDGEEICKPKMPMPICNMVGGWKGQNKNSQSNIQEFLLFPVTQKSFSCTVGRMADAYHVIGNQLENEDKSFTYGKNLESAWITNLSIEDILKIMCRIANRNMFKIGMDVAATNLWDRTHYVYNRKTKDNETVEERIIRTEQLNLMEDLARRFGIGYIEDPFEEEDFVSHATLNQHLSPKGVMICGDDLYATNTGRLEMGIEHKATGCVIIKPNQVGTITDTIKFAEMSRKSGMKTVMSHRSGETGDNLICHLSVGLGCDYVKLGISGERTSKINEMIRIEDKMI